MKNYGMCVLLLLWPMLSGAAVVKAPERPAATQSVGNSKPEPRQRKQKPMPAPAPTNHYAVPNGEPGRPWEI